MQTMNIILITTYNLVKTMVNYLSAKKTHNETRSGFVLKIGKDISVSLATLKLLQF